MKDHIEIDGSRGEGGGRNFRDAVMYATIAALDGWRGTLMVNNIRTTRPKPGIKNSLFGIVDFCKQILHGVEIDGMEDGSLSAKFDFSHAIPAEHTEIYIDVNGVGSAWLLFLAVHPILLHARNVKVVTIHGGTDVFFKKKQQLQTMTPPTRYMQEVWVHNINKLALSCGFEIHVNIIRNHRDKSKFPCAISVTRKESPETVMSVPGLRHWDGCIKTAMSAESGLRLGVSHPDSTAKLPDPDPKTWCDEHFSDMIIPYICSDPEHVKMRDPVSPHHESAIYIAQQFRQ